MKRWLVPAMALLACGAAFAIDAGRYAALAARFAEGSANILSQRFDGKAPSVRLEFYANMRSGCARIVVLGPGGREVDGFDVKGELVHRIEKKYPSEKGEWRISVIPSHGEGAFILKFHDGARFEGMSPADDAAIQRTYAWELGEGG